jgi:hypothetical protein
VIGSPGLWWANLAFFLFLNFWMISLLRWSTALRAYDLELTLKGIKLGVEE